MHPCFSSILGGMIKLPYFFFLQCCIDVFSRKGKQRYCYKTGWQCAEDFPAQCLGVTDWHHYTSQQRCESCDKSWPFLSSSWTPLARSLSAALVNPNQNEDAYISLERVTAVRITRCNESLRPLNPSVYRANTSEEHDLEDAFICSEMWN